MANDRQLVMDYTDFKQSLAEEVWPEVGDSYEKNTLQQLYDKSHNCISTLSASDFLWHSNTRQAAAQQMLVSVVNPMTIFFFMVN